MALGKWLNLSQEQERNMPLGEHDRNIVKEIRELLKEILKVLTEIKRKE